VYHFANRKITKINKKINEDNTKENQKEEEREKRKKEEKERKSREKERIMPVYYQRLRLLTKANTYIEYYNNRTKK